MNNSQLENQETAEIETEAPFELAEDGASSQDAAAKALAEHQMEAMEELREETPFEIDESQDRLEVAEDAPDDEEAGEIDKDAPLVMDLVETKKNYRIRPLRRKRAAQTSGPLFSVQGRIQRERQGRPKTPGRADRRISGENLADHRSGRGLPPVHAAQSSPPG